MDTIYHWIWYIDMIYLSYYSKKKHLGGLYPINSNSVLILETVFFFLETVFLKKFQVLPP